MYRFSLKSKPISRKLRSGLTPNFRLHVMRLLSALALMICSLSVRASICSNEDYEFKVSGASQCLLMRRFGSITPEVMAVWLHGDVSSGGPATYHFSSAEQAAKRVGEKDVLSVALVRPGYSDGSGESSSVALLHGGRNDHYTQENLLEVGSAIERLRAKFQPKIVVLIGHSGGAATAAALLGMKPKLVDAAILIACPCDLVAWRTGKREWNRSENPLKWVTKVDRSTRVVALTGEKDDNTQSELARKYIEALQAHGVSANFQIIADETHNGAFRSPEVLSTLRKLIGAE
nr:alpha/beta hydrolase [uncultured Rhodoferax sp.]